MDGVRTTMNKPILLVGLLLFSLLLFLPNSEAVADSTRAPEMYSVRTESCRKYVLSDILEISEKNSEENYKTKSHPFKEHNLIKVLR